MSSSLYVRKVHYELKGKSQSYDLMPDETYKSASAQLLIAYGDEDTFFLTGES